MRGVHRLGSWTFWWAVQLLALYIYQADKAGQQRLANSPGSARFQISQVWCWLWYHRLWYWLWYHDYDIIVHTYDIIHEFRYERTYDIICQCSIRFAAALCSPRCGSGLAATLPHLCRPGPALAEPLGPDAVRLGDRHHPGAAPAVAPHPDVHLVEPAAVAPVPLRVVGGRSMGSNVLKYTRDTFLWEPLCADTLRPVGHKVQLKKSWARAYHTRQSPVKLKSKSVLSLDVELFHQIRMIEVGARVRRCSTAHDRKSHMIAHVISL